MSSSSNPSRINCEARKCGQTRSPAGCRHCGRTGIECRGYNDSESRILELKHNTRGSKQWPNATHGHLNHIPNEFEDGITHALQLAEDSTFPADDRGRNVDSLGWSTVIPAPPQYANFYPPATIPGQVFTPPVENPSIPTNRQINFPLVLPMYDRRAASILQPGVVDAIPQAGSLGLKFGRSKDPPVLSSAAGDPGLSEKRVLGQEGNHSRGIHPEFSVDWPTCFDDEIDTDPENVRVGMLRELSLDREIQSNIVPFVLHSYASWISRFLFEPTRAISFARDAITRGFLSKHKAHQRMILIANTISTISQSVDYNLVNFAALHQQLVRGVLEARTRNELTREVAMEAMECCHELISITCKVGSLASILNLMSLYAPVFRRACPESGGLVNLPRRLIASELELKYYATFDVLQSTITHSPMWFRYDLNFLSRKDEELLNMDDGPGLRWSYGIPDRLVVTLARMNTLLEDYGNNVDLKTAQELEKEIGACGAVVWSGPGVDPTLSIGRIVVQESWKLAIRVYLYMGLCGANSSDPRVVKVQQMFMRLLRSIKARRNPDSFLVIPMVILGISTSSPTDQSTLLSRLWGVSECSKLGTLGNDVIRILNDVWERTTERPAVWSDLRIARLNIVGM